jgi:hypothetical protein
VSVNRIVGSATPDEPNAAYSACLRQDHNADYLIIELSEPPDRAPVILARGLVRYVLASKSILLCKRQNGGPK